MNSLTARWIFCAGLLLLAACAVLPEPPTAAAPMPVAAPSMTSEVKLARVMRERAELSAFYRSSHPAMIEAAAAETALRDAALAEDPDHFRRDLIRALSDELASALHDRGELSARHGSKHPELRRANTVITALTSAINFEVRSAG